MAANMFDTTDISAPGHYRPSHTALILLDYQKLIVGMVGEPKSSAVLDVATSMRNWARSQGIQVIHGVIGANITMVPTMKNRPRFQQILGAMQAGGSDELPQLLEGEGDMTFARRPGHISALRASGAKEFLQERGIKSLIVMGIATSRVVLSTVLDACDSEFVVTVIRDGCADPMGPLHDALMNVFNVGGYVATAAEFQAGYEARR